MPPPGLRRRALLAAAVELAVAPNARAATSSTTLAVVANARCGFTDLPLDLLRAAFAGEPVNRGAVDRLVPLNDAIGAAVRVEFDRRVLRMEPSDVGRYWVDRRIRGQGGAPRVVPDPALRQRLVEAFPQAITYVRASEARPSVLVLRVDGKLPGDPGYPLVWL
jgi:hypothetical protein